MILALVTAGLVILAALAVERSLLGALRLARGTRSAASKGAVGHPPEPVGTPEPRTVTTPQEQK